MKFYFAIIISLVCFSTVLVGCSFENQKIKNSIEKYYKDQSFLKNENIKLIELDIKKIYKTTQYELFNEKDNSIIYIVIYHIKAEKSAQNILGDYWTILDKDYNIKRTPLVPDYNFQTELESNLKMSK